MTILLYELCGRDRALVFSPYCWRIRMALAHKGLDFTSRPTQYKEIASIEDGSAKAVPVINDGGTVVADSFAIARYLDETYPSRPLMGDEAMVAACRLIESWANLAFGPLIMRMIVMRIYQSLGEVDQPYFRETREARFGRKLEEHWTGIDANKDAFRIALQPARATLAENKWLGGSEPRYADCILFGSLMWLTVFAGALPLAEDDAVTDWFERCRDLHDGFARDAKLAKEV